MGLRARTPTGAGASGAIPRFPGAPARLSSGAETSPVEPGEERGYTRLPSVFELAATQPVRLPASLQGRAATGFAWPARSGVAAARAGAHPGQALGARLPGRPGERDPGQALARLPGQPGEGVPGAFAPGAQGDDVLPTSGPTAWRGRAPFESLAKSGAPGAESGESAAPGAVAPRGAPRWQDLARDQLDGRESPLLPSLGGARGRGLEGVLERFAAPETGGTLGSEPERALVARLLGAPELPAGAPARGAAGSSRASRTHLDPFPGARPGTKPAGPTAPGRSPLPDGRGEPALAGAPHGSLDHLERHLAFPGARRSSEPFGVSSEAATATNALAPEVPGLALPRARARSLATSAPAPERADAPSLVGPRASGASGSFAAAELHERLVPRARYEARPGFVQGEDELQALFTTTGAPTARSDAPAGVHPASPASPIARPTAHAAAPERELDMEHTRLVPQRSTANAHVDTLNQATGGTQGSALASPVVGAPEQDLNPLVYQLYARIKRELLVERERRAGP